MGNDQVAPLTCRMIGAKFITIIGVRVSEYLHKILNIVDSIFEHAFFQ